MLRPVRLKSCAGPHSAGARSMPIAAIRGTTQGTFVSEWRGDILYGRNEAVGGHYILAYGCAPESASTEHDALPSQMLLWHANYHPDGGQLFFPLDCAHFYVPLALPGDDVTPERFVCFRFDGTRGLYIHPNIWHEGVFTLRGRQRFFVAREPYARACFSGFCAGVRLPDVPRPSTRPLMFPLRGGRPFRPAHLSLGLEPRRRCCVLQLQRSDCIAKILRVKEHTPVRDRTATRKPSECRQITFM